jgi:L-cysteine:1D-myo-inositol 2-amino-2-deoxy-alpha-D-glucopyranoside ligase
MVSLRGDKMSKSLGNLVKVSDLVTGGVDPMALRLALLAQHYRADWAWTDALLRAGEARLAAWTAVRHGGTSVDFTPYAARVRSSLRDDLRADQALAVIDEWVRASDAATTDHPGARDQMGAVTDALLGVAIV